MRVARIERLLRQRFDVRARAIGMTRGQWRTISIVRYNDGASQRDIAAILDVGQVTIGRLLARLEADGWIERRADAVDGRVVRVHVAEGASAALAALDNLADEEERRALASLSAADVASLFSSLDLIIRTLRASPAIARLVPDDFARPFKDPEL